MAEKRTILCLASYFKGNRFLQRCKKEGWHVMLLTNEKLLGEPWARDSIDEVFALPNFKDWRAVINAVCYLLRSRKLDRLVALDDFDVELAAHLREHLRLPGMGESTVRFFRDKLAMRVKARDSGIRVPPFTGVFNHDDVRHFLETVPAPWLLKPRGSASAMGIQKHTKADDVWKALEALGDEQSFHVLERMIPSSEMYHIDSLIADKKVIFAEVGKYFKPLFEVWTGGGIYASRTCLRETDETRMLRKLNEDVQAAFRMVRSASHTEFLKSSEDGEFYFVETSARVGGANISEMVEAATGVNLWEEWASIELHGDDGGYVLPTTRNEYGGVTISLARHEHPDTTSFNDPEIHYRHDQKNHIGFVLRSPSLERVESLLNDYIARIGRDYHAVMPPVNSME